MLHATGGPGGLPASFTQSIGSTQDGPPSGDSNWPAVIHALAACAAFVLLMPTGVVFLRVIPESVRWHWANQTLAAALALFGVMMGIYLSTMYTRSQSFRAAHQVIGLVCAAALVLQWALGFWHHRIFKLTRRPTRYGPVHRYFGQAVVVLGVVNGGIGLTWSRAAGRVVAGYVVAVVVVGVAVIAAVVWKRWLSRARSRRQWTAAGADNKNGYEDNVHLTHVGDSRYNQLE